MTDLATKLHEASENQSLDIGTAWNLLAQAAGALQASAEACKFYAMYHEDGGMRARSALKAMGPPR